MTTASCFGVRRAATIAALLLLNCGLLCADDFRAALDRGDELYGRLDDAGAVAQYERAHQLAPDSFEALERLARVSEDLGNELAAKKSAGAEGYFTQAIQAAELMRLQHPDRAQSYFYLAAGYGGLALLKHGAEKVRLGGKVEEYAQKAVTLDPNYGPPYAVLGVFYREIAGLNWIERAIATRFFGDIPRVGYDDALRMLLKAVELYPASLYTHYQLALTYEEAGRRADAVQALAQTLSLPPRNGFEVELKAEARKRLQRLNA